MRRAMILGAFALSTFGHGLNILPLGDSITQGQYSSGFTPGAYRAPLESLLVNRGITPVYHGPWTNNAAPGQVSIRHAGYSGSRTDQVRGVLPSIRVHVERSDVALVLLGTNDINQGRSPESVRAELEGLVTDLVTMKPGIRVLVSRIPPQRSGAYSSEIQLLNDDLLVMVRELRRTGTNVRIAYCGDMILPTNFYMVDNLHPSAGGFQAIANEWDRSLQVTAGDIDGDGYVSIYDYVEFSQAFDAVEGDPRYHPFADIDADGQVTIYDYIDWVGFFDQATG